MLVMKTRAKQSLTFPAATHNRLPLREAKPSLAQSPRVVLLTAPACFSNSRTRRSIGDSGGCSIRHPREELHTDLLSRAMQNR